MTQITQINTNNKKSTRPRFMTKIQAQVSQITKILTEMGNATSVKSVSEL